MIMVTGFGRYQPSSLDLAAFGAPGCFLHPAIGSSSFQDSRLMRRLRLVRC
jgi:hypothetical protein